MTSCRRRALRVWFGKFLAEFKRPHLLQFVVPVSYAVRSRFALFASPRAQVSLETSVPAVISPRKPKFWLLASCCLKAGHAYHVK